VLKKKKVNCHDRPNGKLVKVAAQLAAKFLQLQWGTSWWPQGRFGLCTQSEVKVASLNVWNKKQTAPRRIS